MKKNLKLIITIIGVIFLVGIGITVAYYSVNVNGNPTTNNIEIGAGTVSLEFSDGSSTINVQNVLPGWSAQKTFSVTNTSTATDAELSYQIKLIVTENGFPSGSFKYSLTGTGTGSINKGNTDITSNNIVIGTANITGAGTIHNYTFTLTYKNLSNDQSNDMGKVFKGYITIEADGNVSEDSPIYGVKRSLSTSSTAWTRTDASVGLVANATKNGSAVTNDFDNIYSWSAIKTANVALDGTVNAWIGDANFKFDGTNGEVMTYIPEFYYKRVQEGGYEYQYISASPHDGFTKSNAFYIGRYDIYESDGKAHSKSGVMPTVNKTITQFRTLARSNGSGWGIMDWRYFLIQMLYLVEYADYNSQSKLGKGIVGLGNAERQNQGDCDVLSMKSGTLNNSEPQSVIYREIEKVFGNVWQYVDGINIKDNRAYINYNSVTYVSDKFDGDYQMLGYVNASSNGWETTFGYDASQPLVSFPTSIGGSNSTHIPDFYYQQSGNRIAIVGGGRFSGPEYAGIWA